MSKPGPIQNALALEIKDMAYNNPASIVVRLSHTHQIGLGKLREFVRALVLVLNELYKEKRDNEWYNLTSTGLFGHLLDIASEEMVEKSGIYGTDEFNVLAVSRRTRSWG